ncbi:tryptophan-rich sensory protein [Microbacterium betulae]|uniref:Tryptophan-rich sensory protein n=1 Tax=Microbacterium betulae TaxID=2981139 RepID=A0AA97FGH3_9MICO|nr:tryptophan-rich sensory protein [Microbacterium sp. AB]WOF22453.1 tryptophan-rich sensory protein [Microbacterium sp. AB]
MDVARAADRRRADVVRQTVVVAATVFMIVAAMAGTGLLGGTPVQELQGGALDVDASYLAPARPAFSIWTAIYAGLVAYAVWQALPSQRAVARQRALGWWIAASEALNGLWLLAAQYTTLLTTVVTIFALTAVLGVAFRRAVATEGRGLASLLLIDGVTGLHLGWVALAAVANTAAWLTQTAPVSWEGAASVVGVGVVVLVAVAGIGVALGWQGRGRLAPAIALAWGLGWLAVGRLADAPQDAAIGVAAVVVAAVVVVAAASRKVSQRPRRG